MAGGISVEGFAACYRTKRDEFVAKVIPLDSSVSNEWLGWLDGRDPFSDEAIRHLQNLIAVDHFMVAATVMRERLPFPLVFRVKKTILPAGERLRAEYDAKGKRGELTQRLGTIDLEPLADLPVISLRAKQPGFLIEALSQAQVLASWTNCPIIYTFDGSKFGSL